jgi:ferredoxin-NADP reductase
MATATSAYISNLQKREQPADGTMAFYFAKPLHFEFRAGQSIDLTPVNPPQKIYYIAGPPAMVAAMRQMLVGAGVGEDDIRTEEFAGY